MKPRTTRRLCTAVAIGLAGLIALFAGGSPAWGYFSATSNTANAGAAADTLGAPAAPSTSVSGTTVTVTFPVIATTGSSVKATGYTLHRYASPTGGTAVDAPCAAPATGSTVTCTDTPGSGTFYYSETPRLNSWVGSESARTSAVIQRPVSSLAFTTQPTTAKSGATMTVVVTAKDSTSAVVSGATVTIAIGTNPSSGTLSGTLSKVTDSNGNATFSDLSIDKAGNGYTLRATSASVTATSNTFNITPAKFDFSNVPASVTAGTAFNVTLTAKNADDSSVTNYSGTQTITFSGAGTSPSGAPPAFPASVTFNGSGVGTASSIKLVSAQATVLTATDSTGISGQSNSIAVSASAVAGVSMTSPSQVAINTSFTVTVTVTDTYGNGVPSATVNLTLNPSNSSLTGTKTFTTNSSGIGSSNNLKITGTGNYTLKAASGTPLASNPITVN